MAGYRDMGLRMKVRKFLGKKQKGVPNWELSDRAVAAECECSRTVVKSVRMELISIGEHPPITERTQWGHAPKYQAGAKGRGGYVFDETGKQIRETEWAKRKKAAAKAKKPGQQPLPGTE